MVYNDGRFDYAVWDPISGRNSLPNSVIRMVVHTAVTSSTDIYGPGRGPGETYAHFYNPLDNRIRQHQEIHHKAYADGHANGYAVAVEHQDNAREMPLSAKQIDDDARLFAHLVLHYGMPNRIATVSDTRGLAWHRLGIRGNFPPYNAHDRKTWTGSQTGQNWSDVYGKVCPWDTRIDQIDDIYAAAQAYITGTDADTTSDDTGDDDMPTEKHTGYTDDHPFAAGGKWGGIRIGTTKDGSGSYTLVSGPAYASGTLSLNLQGVPKGTQVLVRSVLVEKNSKGDWEVVHTGFVQETQTAGGTTQIVYPFTENVAKGRRLRFQAAVYGDKAATVVDARARVLTWET